MWRYPALYSAFFALVGISFGFWSLVPDHITLGLRVLTPVLGIGVLLLANNYAIDYLGLDLANLMLWLGACYGYAHAPVSHALQGILLTMAVLAAAVDVVTSYFRGEHLKA